MGGFNKKIKPRKFERYFEKASVKLEMNVNHKISLNGVLKKFLDIKIDTSQM